MHGSVSSQETTTIRAPVRTGEKSYEFADLQMYDPHKLVHFLFEEAGMTMDPDHVRRFWRVKRHEEKEDWAVASCATDDHIPIALYGDGAQLYVHRTVKVLGLFVSFPLWRCFSNRCSRFCIFMLEESKLWKTDTLDAVWQRIAFSMNLLFKGIDTNGKMLAGGKQFCMTEFRGDWLFLKQIFDFASSWHTTAGNVCFRCTARGSSRLPDHGDLFYNCWSDTPNWQERNLVEFIVDQLGHRRRPCSLFYISQFVCSLGGSVSN